MQIAVLNLSPAVVEHVDAIQTVTEARILKLALDRCLVVLQRAWMLMDHARRSSHVRVSTIGTWDMLVLIAARLIGRQLGLEYEWRWVLLGHLLSL